MPYATADDMTAAFEADELIQLTDQAGTGDVDAAAVNRALTDAAGEMDTYIMAQYALPLPETPAALVSVNCDIARYNLHKRKGQVPDAVKSAYDAAIRMLTNLAKGVTKLQVAGAEVATPAETIDFSIPDRMFSRDSLRGF